MRQRTRCNQTLMKLLLSSATITIATLLLPCIVSVSAQEFDDIQNVINEVMEVYCFTPCSGGFTGHEVIPGTKCQWYHSCAGGLPQNIIQCGDGLYFHPTLHYCNAHSQWQPLPDECLVGPNCPTPDPMPQPTSPTTPMPVLPAGPSEVSVIDIIITKPNNPTTEPTRNPTPEPSPKPTNQIPSAEAPSISTTPNDLNPAPISPTEPSPSTIDTETIPIIPIVIPYIEKKKDLIEKLILISYNGATGLQFQSTQYTYKGLLKSLQIMGVDGFGADFKFNLWEGDTEKWVNGLVNLAAFLANAMVESIEDDTCDELNWQKFEGKHAISNSCGQEGRSYEDDNCVLGTTEFMSCDVDPNMYVTAVTSGSQLRAPPPLKCKPGTGEENHAGYWDFSSGRQVTNAPWANVAGRTDIEGCCWWGRGALATRGICNIGKINYYLGKRGAQLGRDTIYSRLDFCKFPELPCGHAKGEQIRWTTAMLEWSERVQRYETLASSTEGKGWNFEEQLQQFIGSGLESESFIDGISRIFSRGCHKLGCSDKGEARMLNKRRSHFFMIVNDVFDIKSVLPGPAPTSKPTRPPVTPFVPVGVLPPAGSQAGVPSTGQYVISNPTDMQQNNPNQPSWLGGNPSQAYPSSSNNLQPNQAGPSWNNPQPSQVIPPSLVSQPVQPWSSNNGGEKPTSWSSNNNGEPSSSGMNGNPSSGTPNSPASQSINEKDSEPSQKNGVDIPSSLPTYEDGGQLVGLESIASRLSAMRIFPWLLSATFVSYYYPL